MEWDLSEQKTAPLPPAANAFHAYLREKRLSWVDVARASGVPCLVVWSMDQGLPVDPIQALRVRHGLYLLTGSFFTGSINTSLSADGSLAKRRK
jgi:hypothetical protein